MNFKFLPKPFVPYGLIVENGYTPVSQPNSECYINAKGERECVCVHFCKQFENYPTIKYGIRYIPQDAKCEFTKDGKCTCDRLVRNGRILRIKPKWMAIRVNPVYGLSEQVR